MRMPGPRRDPSGAEIDTRNTSEHRAVTEFLGESGDKRRAAEPVEA